MAAMNVVAGTNVVISAISWPGESRQWRARFHWAKHEQHDHTSHAAPR